MLALVVCVGCGTSSSPGGAVKPDAQLDVPPQDTLDALDDDTGTDVFAGAGPFVAQPPNDSLTREHVLATGAPHSGRDCIPCHDGSNPDALVPTFAFAGTVYYDADTRTRAAGVEVRVVDASGATSVVYTDVDGNFWRFGGPGTIAWPAHTGARDATDAPSMDGAITDGGCNRASCHDGTADYPRIFLPSPP